MFCDDGGEALAPVALKSCGCPILESVRGQTEWGLEQSGLENGRVGALKIPFNPNHSMFPWFNEEETTSREKKRENWV